jgi:hypothetical protein
MEFVLRQLFFALSELKSLKFQERKLTMNE